MVAFNKTTFSFSGHQTFPLKIQWPYKIFNESLKESPNFEGISAMSELGMGSNMVLSAIFWAKSIGIIDENLSPTKLGLLLFGKNNDGLDPYGETLSTSYIYHWNLANNKYGCSSIWYVFNVFSLATFTREELLENLCDYLSTYNFKKPISKKTLKNDIDTLIKLYSPRSKDLGKYGNFAKDMKNSEENADSALAPLSLISYVDDAQNILLLQRKPKKALSKELFAYFLIDFWQKNSEQFVSLDFETIRNKEGSPGLIFKLDDSSLYDYLEGLSSVTDDLFTWTVQTGLFNVVYKSSYASNSEEGMHNIEQLKLNLIKKAIENEFN